MVKVGVLALQGDFREHIWRLKALNVDAFEVRKIDELDAVDGLIIPGGESTTIGKLIRRNGLTDLLRRYHKPIWGTCAGAILLAKDIEDSDQFKLGLMNITIRRNDYGRQIDSFSQDIELNINDQRTSFNAIFIRAPRITKLGESVKSLAECNGDAVMVIEKNRLATTFHPELTDMNTVHKFFVELIVKQQNH
ncbi:pyridoxal 5'-phosphate synthase glutaminase subunit PdxT [Candidatus Woesearchaeota archaeon]|nr:pyridoxal 5'-phosphate synthase glutaminase subunit PdxT [Candidatus Woesearchaeota archaeon]